MSKCIMILSFDDIEETFKMKTWIFNCCVTNKTKYNNHILILLANLC